MSPAVEEYSLLGIRIFKKAMPRVLLKAAYHGGHEFPEVS